MCNVQYRRISSSPASLDKGLLMCCNKVHVVLNSPVPHKAVLNVDAPSLYRNALHPMYIEGLSLRLHG